MPPRSATDFAVLFESLIDDLRIHLAASVDRTLADFARRLTRLERRLEQMDSAHATHDAPTSLRTCSLCERAAMARGFCSAHYQQWRYRERKNKNTHMAETQIINRLFLAPHDGPGPTNDGYVSAAAIEEQAARVATSAPTSDCK
jgi:hypothetical protein